MRNYLLLFIAITFEVIGTMFMNLSNGFSELIPTVIVFVFYSLALFLCILILKDLEVGFVNAIWSGLGTLLVVILGVVLFNESINSLKIIGLILVVAGITLLNIGRSEGSGELV